MGSFDFITFFFLIAAVVIFLQLRSVLGRRTGSERPPFDPYSSRDIAQGPEAKDNGKVVQLPRRDGAAEDESRYAEIETVAKAGTPLNAQLRAVTDADPNFNPVEFLNGAKMAYEMIVMAFADGDRKTLKGLLSREVYEGFEAAIAERENKGEVVKSTFVGIDKADIVHAEIKDSEENITARIISQLISATYDKQGKLVDGDAESVAEVNDLWTFSRDIRSRDPNWKLIATESEN
ncbi:Tim44/TimA family putative adaptor protein [Sinorhizobium medicae]|uniref:Tim44/TimA family putative adaptor protein n=1 Tax=Sinorhizobium medicae TaxID=110321 RepID=UPI0012950F39|nr:Tim44/TimA family putative adaptor protein [Sinorhizobium medicae]MQV99627.1 Tim44/TimA family putative adaptor protein [Sinorhizobium medicae]